MEKPMRRSPPLIVMLVALMLLLAFPLSAQEDSPAAEPPDAPDPIRTLLINSFLPGTAQIALGDRVGGTLILVGSIALQAGGTALLVVDQLPAFAATGEEAGGGFGWYREGGRTYLWPPDEGAGIVGSGALYDTGLLLSIWGSLLSGYSQWAATREFSDLLGSDSSRTGHESLGELLLAPYRAEYVLNTGFFPFFPMTILGQLDYDDLSVYGRYFSQDRVDFWGMSVHPALGLALNTLFSVALVHANATVEEILFRGLALESGGVVSSSLSFGAAHLPNMLLPGVSIEDTLLQTLFATLFGFYAADVTVRNDYRLGTATALHFWHNVAAFTFGYMEEAASVDGAAVGLPAFTLTVSVRY
jgi:membrane protease YdiL (CAAX protease family)